jgi:hypothetical protein
MAKNVSKKAKFMEVSLGHQAVANKLQRHFNDHPRNSPEIPLKTLDRSTLNVVRMCLE